MRQAERPVNRFARTVTLASRRIATFGAIAGVVAVGAMARMVKGSFTAIDATSKLADNLGLTTKQLVGYQHAAKLSGVSSEQLATGLKRMSKNISDAKLGLTTAQRAFGTEAGLGLDFKRLAELSPDEQFKRIADALSRMKVKSDQVRVALDLFGRSGLGIIKMAEQGSVGLSALQQEAEKLGITFTRLGGAKVEQANDAMARVGAVFKGMANTLAIELAPAVTRLAEKFTAWATAGEGAATKVRSALEQIKPVIEGIGIAFGVIAKLDPARRSAIDFLAGIQERTFLLGQGTSAKDKADFRARANLPGPGQVAGPAQAKSPALLLASGAPMRSGGSAAANIGTPFGIGFVPQPHLASATAFGSGRKELSAPGLTLPDQMDRLASKIDNLLRIGESIEENTAATA